MVENNLAISIIAYNTDRLLDLQIGLLRRFCTDDHDIVVVNNSNTPVAVEAVKLVANKNGCRYIRTSVCHGTGSKSHGSACNQSFSLLKEQYKFFLYLDHDIFPLKTFSVKDTLDGVAIAGPPQMKGSTTYLWPGCVMWDSAQIPNDLIDFSPNDELKLDTGGNLYKIIEKLGGPKIRFLSERHNLDSRLCGLGHEFYSNIHDGTFMHFINYSNWANCPKYESRLRVLIDILKEKTR